MQSAEADHQAAAAEVTVLEGRLASLSADRQKAERKPPFPESSDGLNTLALVVTPTTANTGPTVLRIILGAQLRRLREASGITREEAGYAIRASSSKIVRYEQGRIGAKQRDVADLLNLYGVHDEDERRRILDLTRESNAPGWWHDYSDILPDWFGTYIGLEMAATHMWVYEDQAVPELLQTEDYLRALAVTPRDQEDVPTEEIERRVRLRMARKGRFFDRSNPTNLRVVLDEAVLRRQVGGPAVMRDQLKHLAEMAEHPNITVQVLPAQAGFAGRGSYSILLFTESDLPTIVYIEQLTSALYLDKADDVNVYRRLMQQQSTHALTPQKTTQFLSKLLAASAAQLADEPDAPPPPNSGTDLSSLGFLQHWIACTPDMYTEQGMTARQITEVTGRHDEPNIRSSLDGMIRRGFAELVPGSTRPLRFRMTERFRKEGPPAG